MGDDIKHTSTLVQKQVPLDPKEYCLRGIEHKTNSADERIRRRNLRSDSVAAVLLEQEIQRSFDVRCERSIQNAYQKKSRYALFASYRRGLVDQEYDVHPIAPLPKVSDTLQIKLTITHTLVSKAA